MPRSSRRSRPVNRSAFRRRRRVSRGLEEEGGLGESGLGKGGSSKDGKTNPIDMLEKRVKTLERMMRIISITVPPLQLNTGGPNWVIRRAPNDDLKQEFNSKLTAASEEP